MALIGRDWKRGIFHHPYEESGPIDHSYFDKYPPEKGVPPDELSGWDKDFWWKKRWLRPRHYRRRLERPVIQHWLFSLQSIYNIFWKTVTEKKSLRRRLRRVVGMWVCPIMSRLDAVNFHVFHSLPFSKDWRLFHSPFHSQTYFCLSIVFSIIDRLFPVTLFFLSWLRL